MNHDDPGGECSTCSGSGVLEDWDGEHEWCPVCDSTGVAS